MANVVRCGNGYATKKQAGLIMRLDEITDFTYEGKTVKDATSYIKTSMETLEMEHCMDAWYESGEFWGDK